MKGVATRGPETFSLVLFSLPPALSEITLLATFFISALGSTETLCDGYMISIKKIIIDHVALAKQGGNALDIICLSVHLSVTTPSLTAKSNNNHYQSRVIVCVSARGHHSYCLFCYVHATDRQFCHLVEINFKFSLHIAR